MDTAIRTLRLETSIRGRPYAFHCPSSAESSQKDLKAPIPKKFGLPFIEGECYVVRIGQRCLETVAKRQGRKKPRKIEQRKARGPE